MVGWYRTEEPRRRQKSPPLPARVHRVNRTSTAAPLWPTETATAWLAKAEHLGLSRVIAFAPDNRASLRVIEKLGMRFHRRDILMGHGALVFETDAGSRRRTAVE